MAKVNKDLEKKIVRLGNPLGISAILTILVLVAKVLKSLGILEEMEAKAEATETQVDNIAVRVARTILEELAK